MESPTNHLDAETQATHPSFAEAFRFWVKLGLINFGGPAGQIAIMQTELVERKKWISQARFLHALNYCMLLPGPEAQQLAIYIGWLLHKTKDGIVAGAFFVIPSIFVLWGLSYIYTAFGNIPWIAAVFYGLKPAVTAIVLAAVIRIGRKALRNEVMWGIAAVAFVAIYFLKVPFPVIVLGAGVVGLVDGRIFPVSALDNVKEASADELKLEERFYAMQVKQKDKAGRPDIDAFETAMRRAKCEKGFFVSFDYSSDALREIDRFFREEHRIIVPLTVREILDEEIARKLA